MAEKGPLYRSVNAGDAEGTAIAVAYELWHAELQAGVLNNGPVAAASGEGGVQQFSGEAAARIGAYANIILREMRRVRT